MTTKNVYGKLMDTEIPVTGVTNGNNVPDWFNDEFYNAIALGFENYESDLKDSLDTGMINESEYNDMLDGYESDMTTYLVGDWIKDKNDQWIPDPDGEYSAIYDNNDNYIQVVLSKTTKKCNHCSPCFPGQGDLDSDGEFLAYCLPK